MEAQGEVRDIPIGDLLEPWIIQRRVDVLSVEYLELRSSIEQWGLIHLPLVRPKGDKFEVICGLHRRQVCIDLGKSHVLCKVICATDEEVIELQIQENAIRCEPTYSEYCRQLKKMMTGGMTQRDLSRKLHKEPRWISRVLQMENLTEVARLAVERGEISLESGYELAKIPESEQEKFLKLAIEDNAKIFKQTVREYVKTLREASQQGKFDSYYSAKFKPVAHLKWLKELKAEYQHRKVGTVRATLLTPIEAWYDCLAWVMCLDPEGLEAQREWHTHRTELKVLRREEEPPNT